MEDYLKKFGFTPKDIGLDHYFSENRASVRNTRSEKTNRSGHSMDDSWCNNDFDTTMLKDLPLTMAYVPFQQIESTYDQDEALKAGTLFPNLDKPFLGRRP